MAHEAADREAACEGVVVHVENREGIQVARDDVRLIEYPVRRIPRHTFRVSEQQVLIRVCIDAEVGLDASPRKRRNNEADVGDQAVGFGIDLVLGDVEVRIIELRRGRERGQPAPGAGGRQVVLRIVGLRPQHQAHQRTDVALVHLVVVRIGVHHRQVGGQPGVDPCLGGSGDVDAIVCRALDNAFLLIEGRAQPVVDRIVGRRSAEGQIVVLAQPGSQEAVDIVVELRPGGIRGAEVLERAERAPRHRGRAIDALQPIVRAGPFDPHAGAVLHAPTGPPALRLDHQRAIRRIDAVQRGGFRALEHGHGFDVLRIQVGGTVGEIDTAVTERGGRALIGREHARVDGPVVDRQPVEDDQRLVAAADRAHAADDDRGRSAGYPRRTGDVDAGDASGQGVEEILALRLRDLGAPNGLLRGSQGPLRRGLSQRRDHDGIEIERDPAQLHVDHVGVAHRPLDQPRPDEPELQHLARRGANRVVALVVARGTRVGPFDDDRHAGQGSALLTRHLAGDGLLL